MVTAGLLSLVLAVPALAPPAFRLPISQGYIDLPRVWRFTPADDPSNARAEVDDAAWAEADTLLDVGKVPAAWNGVGWFRTRIEVSQDGAYVLRMRQRGASELFLDGRKIAAFGEIRPGAISSRATGHVGFTLRAGQVHVLAVRYASENVSRYHRGGSFGGFQASMAMGVEALTDEIRLGRLSSGYLWFFTGIFLAFATLHILLFALSPGIRENLYFSLLCLSVAVLAFFLFYRNQMVDPSVLFVAERSMNVCGLAMGFFLLRYVYGTFLPRIPQRLWIYAVPSVGVAIWSAPNAAAAMPFVFILMLVAMIEASRVVVVALVRRVPGARITGLGTLAVAIGFGIGLLANLGLIYRSGVTSTLIPLGSIVVQLGLMSFSISRQFAITNQQLREKLIENEILSAQKLENERRHQEALAERRLLEAEYQRKVEELEEARQLQLSMLPARLPLLPQIEIAVRMDTATEVGGDYYDFETAHDGTLTLAIGDATGHGMRAGTMVMAAKTLFGLLSNDSDLPDTLSRSTLAIKRMNLRKLAMALTLAQYRQGVLRISAAGMPPVCLYRAASSTVEQIQIPGMPLGAMARFRYEHRDVDLAPGDAVLFMTDGFPERLNPEDESFGYDRAVQTFQESANRSAAEIIASLHTASESWAEGRPADDDVTFVVLKVLNVKENGMPA